MAIKASIGTSKSGKTQEESNKGSTCEAVCIGSKEVANVVASAFIVHAKR